MGEILHIDVNILSRAFSSNAAPSLTPSLLDFFTFPKELAGTLIFRKHYVSVLGNIIEIPYSSVPFVRLEPILIQCIRREIDQYSWM